MDVKKSGRDSAYSSLESPRSTNVQFTSKPRTVVQWFWGVFRKKKAADPVTLTRFETSNITTTKQLESSTIHRALSPIVEDKRSEPLKRREFSKRSSIPIPKQSEILKGSANSRRNLPCSENVTTHSIGDSSATQTKSPSANESHIEQNEEDSAHAIFYMKENVYLSIQKLIEEISSSFSAKKGRLMIQDCEKLIKLKEAIENLQVNMLKITEMVAFKSFCSASCLKALLHLDASLRATLDYLHDFKEQEIETAQVEQNLISDLRLSAKNLADFISENSKEMFDKSENLELFDKGLRNFLASLYKNKLDNLKEKR